MNADSNCNYVRIVRYVPRTSGTDVNTTLYGMHSRSVSVQVAGGAALPRGRLHIAGALLDRLLGGLLQFRREPGDLRLLLPRHSQGVQESPVPILPQNVETEVEPTTTTSHIQHYVHHRRPPTKDTLRSDQS